MEYVLLCIWTSNEQCTRLSIIVSRGLLVCGHNTVAGLLAGRGIGVAFLMGPKCSLKKS